MFAAEYNTDAANIPSRYVLFVCPSYTPFTHYTATSVEPRYITEPSYLQETIRTESIASAAQSGSVPIHLIVPAETAQVISFAADACCFTIMVPELEPRVGTVKVAVTVPVAEVSVKV